MLYVPCAMLAWTVAFTKIRHLARGVRDRELIALCAALVFLAMTMTIAIPPVWTRVDAWLHVPNLCGLLSQCSALGFAISIHLMVRLLHCSEDKREEPGRIIRWHLAAGALILVVMTGLFLRIPPLPEAPTDFVVQYAGRPQVADHLTVYILVFGGLQVRNTVLCWHYARTDVSRWLGVGLYMMAVASALGLVYSGVRGIDIVGARLGVAVDAWEPVARLMIFSGAVLASLGCTAPSWGAKISAIVAWLDDYIACARLYPLWAKLCRAVPGIALEPPRSILIDLLAAASGLRFLLLRRVVEINDGIVALRSRLGPETVEEANAFCLRSGLTGPRLRATVEACLLRRALTIKIPGAGSLDTPPATASGTADSAHVSHEVRRVLDIARAFGGSPVVRAFTTTG
ncbi:MAB_1171c family putative transporter [Nonomuraea insulae]|uniref:MAB_1171c family putative transporter n=1 Tax=Nonomuraea insulae TaxID=1616787 RepID=A0ABW1CJG2_9ACTN